MKKWVLVFFILDILALICLFLAYGPNDKLKNLLITTAMTTKDHKYLARILYPDSEIAKVLDNNYIIEINEETNTNDIHFTEIKEQETYESVYEEQILKKDPNNDLYKLIKLEGNGYKGFLVAIYDPSRISLITSKYFGERGQVLNEMAIENDALVAINASGFLDVGEVGNGGTPTGTVIKNGEIIWRGPDTGWSGGLAGFNKDNVLVLTRKSPEQAIADGMVDAVEFGPFLIVNGKPAIMKGNGGWGVSSRTVLAQRKDGIVLFLAIDGRQPGYSLGVTLVELTQILVRYGAYNAVNFDGGASTSLNINGEIVNRPCAYTSTGERWIPNGWALK